MLSFGLEAGARARVNQRFNRLEVLFAAASAQENDNNQHGLSACADTDADADTSAVSPAARHFCVPCPRRAGNQIPLGIHACQDGPDRTAASPQTANVPAAAAATVQASRCRLRRLARFGFRSSTKGLDRRQAGRCSLEERRRAERFLPDRPGDNTPPLKPTEVYSATTRSFST